MPSVLSNRKNFMCSNNRQTGFTLIEVVIAMLVFSVISLISFQALQTYSTQQRLAFEHFDKIDNLQKTILFIKRDINQLFNQEIELKKNVLTLSSLQNDEVLKIRYRLEDAALIREDLTNASGVVKRRLLDNMDKLKFRLRNDKNAWLVSHAPGGTQRIELLELSFENDDWGKIIQLVNVDD